MADVFRPDADPALSGAQWPAARKLVVQDFLNIRSDIVTAGANRNLGGHDITNCNAVNAALLKLTPGPLPASPVRGELAVDASGVLWTYNGSAWVNGTVDVLDTLKLNPGTLPGSPVKGQCAVDTSGVFWVYNGTAWVKGGVDSYSFPTPTWITPVLQNSWVNFGGAKAPLQYCKNAIGEVRIRGSIKNGTFGDGTLLFTLASGYRPPVAPNDIAYFVLCNTINTGATIYINPAGQVQLFGAAGNGFLDINITFATF